MSCFCDNCNAATPLMCVCGKADLYYRAIRAEYQLQAKEKENKELRELLVNINTAYKKAEDDLEVSCLIGEILDRPEVKALLEKDKG